MSSAETEAGASEEAEPDEPTDDVREALVEEVRSELGDALVESHIRAGDDLWVRIERDAWGTFAEVAKQRLRFDFFDFLSAIDWLPSPFGRDMDAQEDVVAHGAPEREAAEMTHGYAGGDTRFQLLGRLASIARGIGITVKADLPDDDLVAGTWSGVYAGANWHERETAEMFGITFAGHPSLTKLYLPGAFEGHPLRKDFPLLARRVKPWPGIVDVEPLPVEESDDQDAGGADAADDEGGDS